MENEKKELSRILIAIKSSDVHTAWTAMNQYPELVNRFYQKHANLMAPQQYRAALKDTDYFMRLLELAEAHELDNRG